jgi:hypothetical protein
LRDEILSIPLGMPLIFLRLNEQLGLQARKKQDKFGSVMETISVLEKLMFDV